ncbi:hypothetical protein GWK47_055230 [Chionoecetes opilio]|uniref:Uncharacterized protein n=1 Tax=Chionoecetes opilio TaxID=41210 RepID=A0A8J5CRD0_CHIOP|nr:hypothetical protein GWK47_055230 [Chionoecetes opilio]
MALSEVNITPLPLPLSTAKRLISNVCRSAWDRSLGDALRATSMGQYRTDSSPHPWIRQTSRVLDVALTRLRIGHTTLRAHLHRLQLTPDPYCPCLYRSSPPKSPTLPCPPCGRRPSTHTSPRLIPLTGPFPEETNKLPPTD